MKYQISGSFSFERSVDDFFIKRVIIAMEDSTFLFRSWGMAEFGLPKKIWGLIDKDLDMIPSSNGSYQGVVCYNYMTYLAEILVDHRFKRLMIKDERDQVIMTYSHYQQLLFMRQMIIDNDYSLPGGYCRQFTNVVEYCIRQYNKHSGNELDFFRMGDDAEAIPEETGYGCD